MKVRILATSDIHGTIMPYSYSDLKPCNHGFLKLKAKMDEYTTDNTLKIDNGDILEGSPFLTYHYKFNQDAPNPMIDLMNDANYDYINIGNHDLNYGQDNLFSYLNGLKAKCICGNILYKGQAIGCDYHIHKFNDKYSIAIIGVVTHYLKNWEREINLKDIEVLEAFEYVRDTVKLIKEKEKVNGIVVVYHGGFEKDLQTGIPTEALTGENEAYRMCEMIDGIDIVISGHQHRSIATTIFNKHVTQTAYKASEIAMIDWDLDTNEISESLLKADSENYIVPDKIKELENKVEVWLDEKVAKVCDANLKVEDEFDARLHKHPVISFINNIQKEVSGAMLSGNALFNGAVGFNDVITTRDIVSTYVYPNTLVVFEITGKILKEYLEKSAEYFDIEDGKIFVSKKYREPKPQHYNYDMVDGIEYTIKVSNEIGHRIIELYYQGNKVKEDDIFTLVVSNYRAAGGGNYFMFKEAKIIKDIQVDMVSLISDYLAIHKELYVNHQDNIKVII